MKVLSLLRCYGTMKPFIIKIPLFAFIVAVAVTTSCRSLPSAAPTENQVFELQASWKGLLTVMTYNIAAIKKPDLDVIAREILDSGADVVGLQEVDRLTPRNLKDMGKQLAEKTKMHVVFEGAEQVGLGQFGLVILSRWPIADHEVIRYPHVNSIPDPDKVCKSKVREQRIGLWATIQVSADKSIRFATTHFGHCILEQQAAFDALKTKIKLDQPQILVGDFNSRRVLRNGNMGTIAKAFEKAGLKEAQTDMTHKLAEPPTERIDWILHTPCWEARNFDVGTLTVSDHRPVMARLRLMPGC